MDERRHSVANPEVCGTHCHVPRYMPLLERNLSDIIDADESHPVKEGNYNDTPLSSLSPGSDIATYPVPQFTFTVDDRESYHLPDDLSLSNHEAIGLHNDNDSTPGPTSKPVLGDRCCWLAAPDSSSGIVSSRTESVCGSDLSVDSSRESDTSQHMDILKKITERLHLATRRPSYIVWKSKYIDEAPNRRLTPTDGMSLKTGLLSHHHQHRRHRHHHHWAAKSRPVVGRRHQHASSKLPSSVLSSARSCRSSICLGRLSTAWLVSLVVFSCHMVPKWCHARSIGRH